MPDKLAAIRQRLLDEATKAGDHTAVRNLRRSASQSDTREPEHCESDFTDRCGR